ncbi:MAG TPA: threonine/serine dehydratase [Allosphingosinicella sp.]|nr:threonine/serine dehydratase [Allosphingosinicella sp.]
MTERKPTPEGVAAAAKRLAPHVVRTPLLPLSWRGVRLRVKAECLQEGGSFKLRGATNRLLLLSEEERRRGVVAFSSGNHAQGVAIAARRLGIPATIVMPADAPAVKRDATLAAGAEIVAYDRATGSREEIAARLAEERGSALVPSFDDVDVIEGQGSAGAEIAEQLGAPPDKVIVPCGGGGLSAGIALALPGTQVVTVEPEGWDDMARSLAAGEPVPVEEPAPPTRCDALQTKLVSPLTLGALRESRAQGVWVGEAQVERAMAFAARHLRIVAEPGGAVALAALLAGKAGAVTERTVVVVSGGNVDPALYAAILAAQAAEAEAER